MHEMALAENLFEQVERVARERGMVRVAEVEVEIGALQLVVPEALRLAWEAAREGSILSEARLVMTEAAPEARCRACGRVFEAAVDDCSCPDCGLADVEFLRGNDIILLSVAGDAEESDS
jgi:hydrogenase nickel insertion protein HypA